jgi:3-(3-hydroxy-phenyl)propionate hydroxylase
MSSQTPFDADVLIVGMGPTGVALAGLLGQSGVNTAIFDRLPDLYPLPRAVGMDHEVMRIAQELGIVERLAPPVAPYRASEYRGVDGTVIKRLDSPPAPYSSGWDPMFVFDQPPFEYLLRERVASLSSVTATVDCEVVAVGQDENSVWADVRRSGAADVQRFTGRYLVACDGGTSPVRESLGIALSDLGFHENWLVVDAVIDDDKALARLPATQVQYCEPRRPATYVSLAGRRRRWEIMLDPGELPIGPVDNDEVWPWLHRWIRPGEARVVRAAAYMFHALVADQWRHGRIFLAGDAAHMTPPFMAQGMAQGMRDAQNLAWKLAAVVRHGGSMNCLMDTYQAERRPHVIATTTRTIELGRIICERDEAAAVRRDRELVGDAGAEVAVTYRSSLLPALSEGLIAARAPGTGQILPQPFVLRGGAATLLDDTAGHGFRVIATPAITSNDRAKLEEEIAPLAGRVVRIHPAGSTGDVEGPADYVERDDVMTDWLDGLGCTIAIARPDHYVYGAAPHTDDALALITDLIAAAEGRNRHPRSRI